MLERDMIVVETLWNKNGRFVAQKMETIEKVSGILFSTAQWDYAWFLSGCRDRVNFRRAYRKSCAI